MRNIIKKFLSATMWVSVGMILGLTLASKKAVDVDVEYVDPDIDIDFDIDEDKETM